MVPRQLAHDGAQAQEGDEVGDGHKAVEGIGDAPDEVQLHAGAQDDDENKHDLVRPDGAAAEEVLPAAHAIKRPAEDRRRGKEHQADGDDDAAGALAEQGREGGDRRPHPGQGADAVIPVGDAGGQDGQARQGADHDGIHEHFKDAVETLADRVALRRRRVGDGGRAEARFVGEYAAADAVFDSQQERAAGRPA